MMKRVLVGVALVAAAAGCQSADVVSIEQPMVLTGVSYDDAWDATMAVLEEHFEIYTSRKKSGDIRTQFEITYGHLEVWRDSAVTRRDRWENTLQTIRRRARAEVTQDNSGVNVSVVVEKERRDRAREGARFSFTTFASIFDPEVGALDRRLRDPTSVEWAPLGRDARFEAYLLSTIKSRLGVQ